MKRRIKIDSSILSFIIILTGLLYQFQWFYAYGLQVDDVFDFLGMILLLAGVYLRMIARGHKKMHSGKGHELVIDGPYMVTRNPMYLGSFLLGAGFVLIVWPWWTLVLFGLLFYWRFEKQIRLEQKHLLKIFGKEYEDYCKQVPQIFPGICILFKKKFSKVFPWECALNTKEKRGLLAWPLLALVLEVLQENIVYGVIDIRNAMMVFLKAMILFAIGLGLLYRYA